MNAPRQPITEAHAASSRRQPVGTRPWVVARGGPWLWLVLGAVLLLAAGSLRQAPAPLEPAVLTPPAPAWWTQRLAAAPLLLQAWLLPAAASMWLLRHLWRTAAVEAIDPGAETMESIEPLDFDLDTGARTITAPGLTTAGGTAEMAPAAERPTPNRDQKPK
jgi:hypothetical protein